MPSPSLSSRVKDIHSLKMMRRRTAHHQRSHPDISHDDQETSAVDIDEASPIISHKSIDSTLMMNGSSSGDLLGRSPPADSTLGAHVYQALNGTHQSQSTPEIVVTLGNESHENVSRQRKRTVSSPSLQLTHPPPLPPRDRISVKTRTKRALSSTNTVWTPLNPSPLSQAGALLDEENEGEDSLTSDLHRLDTISVDERDLSIKEMARNASTSPSSSRRSSYLSNNTSIGGELHGSFVGNYEESILTGRLSTPPSKPIQFICQIGVVGMDSKGPVSLKCPPHVTIPFQASFYEWPKDNTGNKRHIHAVSAPTSSTSRSNLSAMFSPSSSGMTTPTSLITTPRDFSTGSMTEELGTPYVGTIDLEWGLGRSNLYGYAHTISETEQSPAVYTDPSGRLPSYRSVTDPEGIFLKL